jgi:hypothetical protein
MRSPSILLGLIHVVFGVNHQNQLSRSTFARDEEKRISKKVSQKYLFHLCDERPPSGWILTKLHTFGEITTIIYLAKFHVDR